MTMKLELNPCHSNCEGIRFGTNHMAMPSPINNRDRQFLLASQLPQDYTRDDSPAPCNMVPTEWKRSGQFQWRAICSVFMDIVIVYLQYFH